MKNTYCKCGNTARGPYKGYCGQCGQIITNVDPERDNRWKQEMKRLAEIDAIKDEDIDTSDIPEADEEFFKKARLIQP